MKCYSFRYDTDFGLEIHRDNYFTPDPDAAAEYGETLYNNKNARNVYVYYGTEHEYGLIAEIEGTSIGWRFHSDYFDGVKQLKAAVKLQREIDKLDKSIAEWNEAYDKAKKEEYLRELKRNEEEKEDWLFFILKFPVRFLFTLTILAGIPFWSILDFWHCSNSKVFWKHIKDNIEVALSITFMKRR